MTKNINYEKLYNAEVMKNVKLYKNVNRLQEEIKRQTTNQQIELLNAKIKESNLIWKRECLGFNKGTFIYITYKRLKTDEVRSLMGYVTKESQYHIKVMVHARNANTVFSYQLRKENIIDIKNYHTAARGYISFEECSKIKKQQKEEAKSEE